MARDNPCLHAATRYRDVRRETYSKGVGAYIKLLRKWREDGELDGLELN